MKNGVRSLPKKNTKMGKADKPFSILVVTLVTIGLIMLFSASHVNALYNYGDSFHFIKSQLVWAAMGLTAMYIISRIDYHIFGRFAYLIMGITFVFLVVVLFMKPLNGAKRWIDLGFTTFQPSEIAKFAVVVLFSLWISKNASKMKTFKYGVVPFAAILIAIAGLMVLQPHLSGTILIMSIGLILMFVGGTDRRWFIFGGVAIVIGLLFVVFFTDAITYATDRLQFWLDPFKDAQGKGFQTIQSLLAIGSGGFFGVGLGNSRQKQLYVPEPQNDFIFAIICEELGFIGAVLIIFLFMLLLVRGISISMRAKDKFGSMLALGLTVQVILQAMLNIMVVTNTIPNTGISLPFFSYGGTSLVMLLAQMGVVLSVSRQSNMVKD